MSEKKQDKFTAGQLDAATFANCRNTNRSLLEWQGPGPDATAPNLIALAPRSGLLWSPISFDAGRKITINFLLPFIDFVPDGYWGWLFPRTI